MHEGFHGVHPSLGDEIGAAHANDGNGGVQAVTVGLVARGVAGNLAYGALDKLELDARLHSSGVDLIVAYEQLRIRTQGNAALVRKDENGHGVRPGAHPIPRGEGGAHLQGLRLAAGGHAQGFAHGHGHARHSRALGTSLRQGQPQEREHAQ